jgi:hypothetical protein
MAPRIEKNTFDDKNYETSENDLKPCNLSTSTDSVAADTSSKKYEPKIVWRNVLIFIILHAGALTGVYCCFNASFKTLLFGIDIIIIICI